jgi:hypothetical protein
MRLALPALALALCACSASYQSARAHMVGAPAVDRSLFAPDPEGRLAEADLQRLLASPIELDLPARVGVVPIVTAHDWRGPSPDWTRVPRGASAFAAALAGSQPFTMVTEVLPIPSGALGMEALREVAARYALRYILLYREGLERRSRANGVAAGYATLLGALFLPGQTLAVDGFVEASLFDVKTGLLLFTVRRTVHADRTSNVWYNDQKLADLIDAVTRRAAPELAGDVRGDVDRFAAAVKVESQRRSAL